MILKILQKSKLGDIKGVKKNWIKILNTVLNIMISWQGRSEKKRGEKKR